MANKKRLIDANALLLKLKKHHDLFIDAWEGFSNLPEKDKARVDEISNCIADVFNAPTVDAVEVVHGYWAAMPVRKLNSKGKVVKYCDYYHCSECGTDRPIVPPYNYCPNCGAKMDGDGNDKNNNLL